MKNYQKFLAKYLKDQFIGMNIRQKKVIIKIQQTDLDFSLESHFVVTKRLLVLVYSNEHAAFKRFKAKRYCLPEGLIDNYNVIINEKIFYDQGIDSDIK